MTSSKKTFENESVQCDVEFLMNGDLHITGKVSNSSKYVHMRVFAARHVDRLMNYSGSGLPFPCAQVAFDQSPNVKDIDNKGTFDVMFTYPNGYYLNDAKEKVPPSIFFLLAEAGKQPMFVQFKLPDPLPLRTLGYRPNRQGPLYYSVKEDLVPIASAQDTMMNYAAAKIRYDLA